ncbi:ester cyclase [Actinomadura alba]|uniref:Ester cyclase n=1 Tax=Actinomadura alba TaxID=406431 RepID=A0ABR7LU38_9ACTN|nr:ester cyclase [Actinomadura alba]MBC6468364.1 ester cyclase [Actinomadura alba]
MASGERVSPEERNKALARRWLDEGWCRGELDLAYQIFASGFVMRGRRVGPEGPRQSARLIRAAFGELSVEVGLQVAQGDQVATHYTARGRHVAEYRGIPPTGRSAVASGIQIWTVRGGLVVADLNVFDEWGLVSQLR